MWGGRKDRRLEIAFIGDVVAVVVLAESRSNRAHITHSVAVAIRLAGVGMLRTVVFVRRPKVRNAVAITIRRRDESVRREVFQLDRAHGEIPYDAAG